MEAHSKGNGTGAGRSVRQRMKADERGQQVLDIATKLFAEKGFDGTSMNDIAAACGVTKPVLYAHYESKEVLFKSAMDVLGQTLADALVVVLHESDPTLRLKSCLAVALTSIQNFGGNWPEIGSSSNGGKNGMMSRIEMHRDQILAAMADALVDLRPAGTTPEAVRPVCEFYVHLLYGGAICTGQWWLDTQKIDVASIQQRGDSVIDMFVAEAIQEMEKLSEAGKNA